MSTQLLIATLGLLVPVLFFNLALACWRIDKIEEKLKEREVPE